MSNWSYVAIAFIAVWGALAVYALTLARRVTQAARIAEAMREASQVATSAAHESAVCDAPPVR